MAKLALKPVAGTNNKVFVEPVKRIAKKSAGGIVTTVGKDEPPYEFYGEVVAVSDCDDKGMKPNVAVGETVFFGANFTTETFEGYEYFQMKEGNIYAKL